MCLSRGSIELERGYCLSHLLSNGGGGAMGLVLLLLGGVVPLLLGGRAPLAVRVYSAE